MPTLARSDCFSVSLQYSSAPASIIFQVKYWICWASCPSQRSYTYFFVLSYFLLATGLGSDVRCLPLLSSATQTFCTSSIARGARNTNSLKGLGDLSWSLPRSHFQVSVLVIAPMQPRATCSVFQSRSSSLHPHPYSSCASTAIRGKTTPIMI